MSYKFNPFTGTFDEVGGASNVNAGQVSYDNTTSGLSANNVQDAIDEVQINVEGVQDNLDAHINETTNAHAASAIGNVPSGNVTTNTVQLAINELDTLISNHITDTTDAHDASSISTVPSGNLTATDVQSALNELQSDVDTRALQSDLLNHINDTAGAHAASAISNIPAGTVSSTDVQSAINELDLSIQDSFTDINNHITDTTDAHLGTAIGNTPAGTIAATTVQAAINELDGDVQAVNTSLITHINNTTGAHAASAISNIPSGNLSATDVQGSLNELQTDVDSRALQVDLNDHITDTTDAHDASAISYDNTSSGLSSTNVQTAVDELNTTINSLPNPIYYAGTYNATTNTPTLANTDIGAEGRLYRVAVAGTQNFGAGAISFDTGDSVVNNGTIWEKWDHSDQVLSVNSQTGAVQLNAVNIPYNNTTSGLTATEVQAALDEIVALPETAITDLTGDATATGPGSAALTLATVNSNVGSFTNANITVNAKGLITAAANGSGGANTTLSNLTSPTSINQNLLPSAHNLRELGTPLNAFSTITSVNFAVSNGSSSSVALFLSGVTAPSGTTTAAAISTPASTNLPLAIFTGSKGGATVTNNLLLETGNQVGTANSGNVIIQTGTSTATRGKISFRDGTEGTAGYVWTSTNTTGQGAWQPSAGGAIPNKETFVLSSTDITNQYVDLSQVATTSSVNFIVKGSGAQIEGASYDYSVNYTGGLSGNTRITFLNDLATGGPSALIATDVVQVTYTY